MNSEIIIAAISLIIAIFACAAAFWSALEARKANRRADQANSLAAESNRISKQVLDHQELHAPPPWSQLTRENGYTYSLENKSGKDIEILKISPNPTHDDNLSFTTKLPTKVSYGDKYSLIITSPITGRPSSIDIEWRFSDSPSEEKQTTRRIVH